MAAWNGSYWLEFESNLGGKGIGILHIAGHRMWGGDGGYKYRGIVGSRGGVIVGKVLVDRVEPLSESIFGKIDHFEVEFSGKADRGFYTFSGWVLGAPTMRVRFTLRRVTALAAE